MSSTLGEHAASDRLAGILLGTAVGDAVGLPAEGISPARRRRMMPGSWQHRFLFGRGMVSDDTEHALFVAQSLLRHPTNADAFQRRLAWHLRWWFVGLPAGIGLATARACLKLWFGFPPARSGVFSAGNGPAIRQAVAQNPHDAWLHRELALFLIGQRRLAEAWLTRIIRKRCLFVLAGGGKRQEKTMGLWKDTRPPSPRGQKLVGAAEEVVGRG